MLLDGLRAGLGLASFTVDAVSTCEEADAALRANEYRAVVLDLMLPDGSGLDVLAALRKRQNTTPVVLLTARDQVEDRIAGLDAGADDYIGKPFDLDELAARVRAAARRGAGLASALLEWNGVVVDTGQQTVSKHGRALSVTRREFAILRKLMEHPGSTVSKSTLEDTLYGWQEEVESNAVEVHVHHLRNKLGSGFIKTVRGLGYRLAEECA